MFVAKINEVAAVMATVAEKKIQYSMVEVKRAEVAYMNCCVIRAIHRWES
jgi:hypothetical protein